MELSRTSNQPTDISNTLRTVFHAVALIPLIIVMLAAAGTTFGLLPGGVFLGVTSSLANVSTWTFSLLLACMPLHIVTGWRWPLEYKRPLGLYTFLYAVMHYFVFTSAFGFAVGPAAAATVSSFMLFSGFVGLALMAPLALTSNRFSMRKLGRNWKRLHYLTYAVAIFIILHLFALGQGFALAIFYTMLLAVRIPVVRKQIVKWRKQVIGWWQSVQTAPVTEVNHA